MRRTANLSESSPSFESKSDPGEMIACIQLAVERSFLLLSVFPLIRSWSGIVRSLEHAPPEEFPRGFDPARAMAEHAVVQDKSKIAISGDEGHQFADF